MTETRSGSLRDDRQTRRATEAAREAAKQTQNAPATLMTGGDGNLVATSANVDVATGNTPRTGGADGNDDEIDVTLVNLTGGGSSNDDEEEKNDGGGDSVNTSGGTTTTTTSHTGTSGTSGATDGVTMVPPVPPAPAAPAAEQQAAPARQTVVYQREPKEKRLRLPKFKGLDEPKMTVKAWLRAVKNEIRRQLAILRINWFEREVFLEMVANFEGEALLWYDTVEDSLDRVEDQTFGNLSRLLKDRYMVKRSNPEVIARLKQRRQQRGEPLVEYAQKLREIVSGNDIGEEWLVDAFLAGMSNSWNASLVRGHKPSTLNAAVNAALDQVGECGEGYGVGLGQAMAQQDGRSSASGGTLVAGPSFGQQVQMTGMGNLGAVVTGFEDFGVSAGPPPRYDTEGRLVLSRGTAQQMGGQWNSPVIPEGYTLVPKGTVTGTRGASSAAIANRATAQSTQVAIGQRTDGGGKTARRSGKTMKMEGTGSQRQWQQTRRDGNPGLRDPLPTKEDRLRNFHRYEDARARRAGKTGQEDAICFYCHQLGHFVRSCPLKDADMAGGDPMMDPNGGDGDQNSAAAGNGQRA